MENITFVCSEFQSVSVSNLYSQATLAKRKQHQDLIKPE